MKEMDIKLNATDYLATLEKIQQAYANVSKRMVDASKSAKKNVESTNTLELAIKDLTVIEADSLKLTDTLEKARKTLAKSRSIEGKAAYKSVLLAKEEAAALKPLLTAKLADGEATVKHTKALHAQQAEMQRLAEETAKYKASAAKKVEAGVTASNSNRDIADAQRLINIKKKGEAEIQAIQNSGALKQATNTVKNTELVKQSNAALKRVYQSINNDQAKADQGTISRQTLLQEKLKTTALQQAKIQASINTQNARTNNLLVAQTKAVEGQLIAWKSIQRVVVGQLTFRAISLGIGELSSAYAEALKYNKAIAEIQTISQHANLSSREWAAGLREVSNASGISALTVAEAAYQSLSNQVTRGADTFKFLETANRFALAAVTDTKTAVDILSSAMNSYSLGTAHAEDIAAKYFKTIELGRIRASELASVMGRLEVSGNVLGIGLDELGAVMATMTNQGITAAKAATQFQGAMNALIKPSDDMKLLLADIGVASGEDAISVYGLAGVFELLAEKTKGSTTELAKLFRNQRALLAAITTTGDGLTLYKSNLEAIKGSAESYARAQLIIAQSTEFTVRKSVNEFHNFFVTVGDYATEGTADFVKAIDTMGLSLQDLFVGGVLIAGAVKGLSKLQTGAKILGAAVQLTGIQTKTLYQQVAVSNAIASGSFGNVATAAEASSIRIRAALIKTGVGALVVGLGLVAAHFANAALTAESASDRIARSVKEAAARAEDAVKESAATFTGLIGSIRTTLLKASANVNTATRTNYLALVNQFTKSNTDLEESLRITLVNFEAGLKKKEAAIVQSNKRTASLLSAQLASEANQLAIDLAKINSEDGGKTKLEAESARLSKKRASAEAAYSVQQRKDIYAVRQAVAGGDKDVIKNARTKIRESKAAYDTEISGIKEAEDEVIRKGKVQEDTIKLYNTKASEQARIIANTNAETEAGLQILKERSRVYIDHIEAEQALLLAAGRFADAEKLNTFAQEQRIALAEKIRTSEEAFEDAKLERAKEREKELVNIREAGELRVQIAKLKTKAISESDTDKLIEIQTAIVSKATAYNERSAADTSAQGSNSRFEASRDSVVAQQALRQLKILKADNEAKEKQLANLAALNTQEEALKGAYDHLTTAADGFREKLKQGVAAIDILNEKATGFFESNLSKGDTESLASGATSSAVSSLFGTIELDRALERAARLPAGKETDAIIQTLKETRDILDQNRLYANAVAQANNRQASDTLNKRIADINGGQILDTNREAIARQDANTAAIRELTEAVRASRGGLYKATGGAVSYFSKGGGPRGTDTVPAWLTPGEYVVNAKSTARHRGLLEAINSNSFAGSSRPMSSPKYLSGGGAVNTTTVGNISVSMQASGNTQVDVLALGQQLQREIRRGRISFANT